MSKFIITCGISIAIMGAFLFAVSLMPPLGDETPPTIQFEANQ